MGKQRFRKGLAGGLAALMLLQAMPMAASARSFWDIFSPQEEQEETSQVEVYENRETQVQLQDGTAVIPSGASADEVKQILFDALVFDANGMDVHDLEWEYYFEGKSDDWIPNEHSDWGSVDGFTSSITTSGWFGDNTTYYTHPALADNSDGTYQVRIADTDTAVTLNKQSKYDSAIELKEGPYSVNLPRTASGDVDYNALREAIWDELVESTTPVLEWNDVTIEYLATSALGTKQDWAKLEGETKDYIYTYPAISASETTQQIRISWDDEDNYYSSFDRQVSVTITDEQEQSSITLASDQSVALPYDQYAAVDYEALEKTIFENVVINITPEYLTATDLDIKYYATAPGSVGNLGKEWMPLSGGKSGIYYYPAISAGTQTLRFSWTGDSTYEGFSDQTTTVNIEDPIMDQTYTAALVYADGETIDYNATARNIFDAVVGGNGLAFAFEDVTIQYNAALTDLADNYQPLDNSDWTTLKKFGEGTWEIRFSWDGTQDYQAGAFTVTVTVEERPEAPYTLKDPTGSVTITVDENLETNFDALRTDIFNAVVASSDILTAENVTITYYAEAVTGSVGDLGWNWVSLEGGTVNALKYPAISAGEQKIRISWPGNQTYAPTTIEATVTVNDREQIQFNLNEGPYEVGMKFTADQGYDYEATAQAIYEAVVTSNSLNIPYDQMTVEYNTDPTGTFDLFKPLNETDATGLVKFGTGEWEIRISWPGNQQYRGNSVTVNVTTTDNRHESSVALKSGVSFTYNMDPSVMEQAIFDSVIDWENSTLPAKETLSLDDFTIEYYGTAVLFDGGIDSDIQNWVPVEGKSYDLGGLNLGAYPQLGAGENQQIRVSFHGNADYRPSDSTEGTVTVDKATVKVSVHSDNIYADEALPEGFITTDPADDFDQYVIYAGITSNVTTALYLDLPDRYDDNAFLQILDPVVEAITGKSFTDMLNDGVTVGELRELLSTQELLDLLDKLNIDTGTFGQILEAVNKMPGILDSVRISFGAPNRAGLYTVAVVTDNQNYETGFGMGFLLVKMHLSGVNLTWNQKIQNGKLTAEEAKTFDFGATLSYDGDASISQESVSYLYSGFTSKWRVYSSTTTPPTEPGRYVMTVVTLGGNYQAAPITRSFQITK